MKILGERFRHSFPSWGHIRTSVPERQQSVANFVFEGASGRVELRRVLRRAVCMFCPETCTRAPDRASISPFPVRPLENENRRGAIPSLVPVWGTRPHLGPRMAVLRCDFRFRGSKRASQESSEGLSEQPYRGWCMRAPEQVSDSLSV